MTETIPATFEVLDERFRACSGDGRIERLAGGCRWAEGPVYVPAGRYLVWSDIPNDRMLRWDEATEAVGVFRQPAGYTNGNTLDAEGRMLSCEHGGRRVSRTEHDGSVTTIADRIDGKRLNSPNDVVVRSDRSIWFTRPTGSTATTRGIEPRARSAAATSIASTGRPASAGSSPTTSTGRTASRSRPTSRPCTSPTHGSTTSAGSRSAPTGG